MQLYREYVNDMLVLTAEIFGFGETIGALRFTVLLQRSFSGFEKLSEAQKAWFLSFAKDFCDESQALSSRWKRDKSDSA